MPMYDYLDKTSGKQVSVIRSFDKYEEQPTQEEAEMSEKEYRAAVWERVIGSPQVLRGNGWGSKGHW